MEALFVVFPSRQNKLTFSKPIPSFLNQVLLPLWNFAREDVVGLEVTQLQWSSKYLGKIIAQ